MSRRSSACRSPALDVQSRPCRSFVQEVAAAFTTASCRYRPCGKREKRARLKPRSKITGTREGGRSRLHQFSVAWKLRQREEAAAAHCAKKARLKGRGKARKCGPLKRRGRSEAPDLSSATWSDRMALYLLRNNNESRRTEAKRPSLQGQTRAHAFF